MNVPIVLSPPVKPIKHRLYEVDRENKIAFCTACGWTEIHVPESRKEKPKFFCIKRLREITEAEREIRRLKSEGKPRHFLTKIDTENMIAYCAICGQTKIQKRLRGEVPHYSCATKERTFTRNRRRKNYAWRSTRPLAHVLSDINEETKTALCSQCGFVEIYVWRGEKKTGRRCSNAPVRRIPGARKIRREININIINRRKVEYGCSSCGYNANLLKLNLYTTGSRKKALRIERLLLLNGSDVISKLENSEILCISCR